MNFAIDSKRLTENFCSLVAIDAPSFGERAMTDEVRRRLEALGLQVEEDGSAERIGGNAGTLLARLPGEKGRDPLLLCAHLDTVAPALGKQASLQADGTITSAGDTVLGADDLSAVAEILEAVQVLQEQELPHRPLELLFFPAEEPYTLGSRAYDFSGIRAKEAIVADLEGAPGIAALRSPTILYLKITVRGKASHAGFCPEEGIHAVKIAANAISRLSLGHTDGETTVNIGTIQGGMASNIIPAECVMEAEIRGYSQERVLQEQEKLYAVFRQEAEALGGSVEFEREQRVTAVSVPEESALARKFRLACEKVNLYCRFTETLGGSDASSTTAAGITTLVISNGMHEIHSVKEWTTVQEMTDTCRLLLALCTME